MRPTPVTSTLVRGASSAVFPTNPAVCATWVGKYPSKDLTPDSFSLLSSYVYEVKTLGAMWGDPRLGGATK